MSYRFNTFNNYVPFEVYIKYLSSSDMKQSINELYAEAKGCQYNNLTLDANNGATLKTLLLLVDYCFKSTPFSSKQQIDFLWMASFIMDAIKGLFSINPHTCDSYQGKVSYWFSMIISKAEEKRIVDRYDFEGAIDLVDMEIGMENFDFC